MRVAILRSSELSGRSALMSASTLKALLMTLLPPPTPQLDKRIVSDRIKNVFKLAGLFIKNISVERIKL